MNQRDAQTHICTIAPMPSRPTGIIFDLFGTLIDNLGDTFVERAHQMGALRALLATDDRAAQFVARWKAREMYLRRVTGHYPHSKACVLDICADLGVEPGAADVDAVTAIRTQTYREALVPRPDVIPTMKLLKQRGYRMALMSVCGAECPELLPQTDLGAMFDGLALSCEMKLMKPDPRFYQAACSMIDAAPEDCVYVADGDFGELQGAAQLGMRPILICAPHEADVVMRREGVRTWQGERISAISELLTLLP